MGKFRALVVLNLKAMLLSSNMGTRGKKRAVSGAGVLVLMGALCLYLSGVYSFLLAAQLAPIGMLKLLLMLLPVLAVVVGTMFTLFAAQGIVFGGRDNDLMLSLPVSAFSLMLSRTMALYLENLVFSVFLMAPAGAAYLWYGGTGGVAFALRLLLCTLFLALLPTLLALLGGFVMSWLTGKFQRKALLGNVFYFAFFLLMMVFAFRINFIIAGLAQYAAGIERAFSVWGVPFLLLAQATCEGNVLSLLAFLALCALPFLGVVWLFARRYGRIVTRLASHGAKANYKLGTVAASGQGKALLKKEFAKFFGTPIYLFNTGMGLVMLVLGGGAAVVLRGELRALLADAAGMGAELPLLPLLAAGICFLLSTVGITACSISLEGRYLWILKEAPVPVARLFAVKVGFQLLLTLPCMLFCALCAAFAVSLPAGETVVLVLLGALFAVFTALLGLTINLYLPRLDAPNDTVVVKQSGASMLAVLGTMLLVGAGGLLYVLLHKALGGSGVLLLCALLLAGGSALLLGLLRTRGGQLFAGL